MPFPSLDPVIFEIGPFALRWYALAYIAGLMLGWRYVIMLSQSARFGRKARRRPRGDRRPAHVDHFWRHIGRASGLCDFL